MLPHTQRPDGDNLEKFVNDALRGLIWADDSQIVWLLRSKTYTADAKGCTVLHVRELLPTYPDYNLIIDEIIEHYKVEQ